MIPFCLWDDLVSPTQLAECPSLIQNALTKTHMRNTIPPLSSHHRNSTLTESLTECKRKQATCLTSTWIPHLLAASSWCTQSHGQLRTAVHHWRVPACCADVCVRCGRMPSGLWACYLCSCGWWSHGVNPCRGAWKLWKQEMRGHGSLAEPLPLKQHHLPMLQSWNCGRSKCLYSHWWPSFLTVPAAKQQPYCLDTFLHLHKISLLQVLCIFFFMWAVSLETTFAYRRMIFSLNLLLRSRILPVFWDSEVESCSLSFSTSSGWIRS